MSVVLTHRLCQMHIISIRGHVLTYIIYILWMKGLDTQRLPISPYFAQLAIVLSICGLTGAEKLLEQR
jgi:hypothetical protein